MDHNVTVPFWPAEDMSTPVSDALVRGGGSACNFAIDMRKLDPTLPVDTMGLIGDDEDGRFLERLADEHGIRHDLLRRTSSARTHCVEAYQSLQSGRRTHLFHAGASDRLCPDDFDFSHTTARFLHLGMPGIHARMDVPWQDDVNGWVTVLKRAQAAGLRTNLELVTIERDRLAALARPCLPYLDTLIVNEYEIGALAGIETIRGGQTDEDACREAIHAVLRAGAMDFVVVHYVLGAQLVARDGTELQRPSVDVPQQAFVGANGAGDAFAAGFLCAHHRGWELSRCMELAHAAAAACLRSIATVDGVESAEACLQLASAWGWRRANPGSRQR